MTGKAWNENRSSMGIKTGRGQYENKWIEGCNRYGLKYGMVIANGVWNRLDCTVYYERLHLDMQK